MEFTHHLIDSAGCRIHAVERKALKHKPGRSVLLLHGWPQTWIEWTEVLGRLDPTWHLVATDLRGCGDSDRPREGYDLRTQAADQWAVLDALGVGKAAVIGHDLGGPVAYAMACSARSRVTHLGLFEAPLFGVESETGFRPEASFWHMLFHQESDLPEALIGGREELYFRWFYRNFAYLKHAISEAQVREYVRAYSAPGGLRGGFAHYRAIPESTAQISEWSKTPLDLPVAAYGGEVCLGSSVLDSARKVARNVRGGTIEACGHWVAEERPDEVARLIHQLVRRES